jgi:hypothetical protein
MQDGNIIDRESVRNRVQVTVPANAVDLLREALYAEIVTVSETLDAVGSSAEREQHPEWFRGPKRSLDETYALLDTLGWSRTAPATAVEVELHGCCWGLMQALGRALYFADENLSKEIRRDAEERGLAAERECIGILSDFISVMEARIDALAVRVENGTAQEAA